MKQFLQEEESRNAIVSVPCGGRILPFLISSPRTGMFANLERRPAGFLDSSPLPSHSSFDYDPLSCRVCTAVPSKDLVHLGGPPSARAPSSFPISVCLRIVRGRESTSRDVTGDLSRICPPVDTVLLSRGSRRLTVKG